jgi:diguanylate cyclase (GGDEF)-like protein
MSTQNDYFVVNRPQVYRLRFKRSVETEYRIAARGMRRYTRTILLALLGLCFLLGPLYESPFFETSPTITPLLRVIEWVIVGPVALTAAVVTYLGWQKDITYALQTVATLALWAGPLFLRHLALEGQMQYPSWMVTICVLGIAIFAGFNWYRIAFGVTASLILAGVQEYLLDPNRVHVWLHINGFVWTWLIAMLGSYVNETRFRLAWISGRTASLMAKTDTLTGLSNRLEFNQLFPRIIKQASREQVTIAVALIDIDHFKKINDTYGHACGDEVLSAVGTTLLDNPPRRPFDLKVRYGGEEFAIVWHAVSPGALPQLIRDTLDLIRGVRVATPDGNGVINVTASIGATYLIPDEATQPQLITAFADRLLYQAKDAGRNRALIKPFLMNADVAQQP